MFSYTGWTFSKHMKRAEQSPRSMAESPYRQLLAWDYCGLGCLLCDSSPPKPVLAWLLRAGKILAFQSLSLSGCSVALIPGTPFQPSSWDKDFVSVGDNRDNQKQWCKKGSNLVGGIWEKQLLLPLYSHAIGTTYNLPISSWVSEDRCLILYRSE